jgi:lysozyme
VVQTVSSDTLAALMADLRRDEGLRLKPYVDTTGHISIGYGRNLTDIGITRAEAEAMLREDTLRHVMELEALLPWVKSLDPVRQRAMGNLAFNLGLPTLRKFPKFLGHMERKEYAAAAVALLQSRYAQQVGARADRLAVMIRDGVSAG